MGRRLDWKALDGDAMDSSRLVKLSSIDVDSAWSLSCSEKSLRELSE